MKIITKYKAYKEYLRDIQDRLIHIEGKVDALMRNEDLLDENDEYSDDSKLRIAIKQGGGVGDALLDIQLAKTIYLLAPESIQIDFYCKAYRAFEGYSFINEALPAEQLVECDAYDVILIMHRIPIVSRFNKRKVWNTSTTLYKYLADCEELILVDFQERLDNKLISDYALIRGKNRIEQGNVNGILDFDRNTCSYMPIDKSAISILDRLNLLEKKYIVINRGVDRKYDNNHPKLWPMEKYNELIKKLKDLYPDVLLVQLGDDSKFGYIEGIDINLVEKTSLEECKVILKNSLLLISGEGGLVHFNHFLNNKSVVLFGPTNPDVFGYEENINITSRGCDSYCEGVAEVWRYRCIKGYDVPPCMNDISVDCVLDAVKEIMNSCNKYELYIQGDYISEEELKADIESMNALGIIGLESFTSSSAGDYYDEKYVKKKNFVYGSPFNIPSKKEKYDCVISKIEGTSLEIRMRLNEIKRILKDDGEAIIKVTCDNRDMLVKSLQMQGINILNMDSEKYNYYLKLGKRKIGV